MRVNVHIGCRKMLLDITGYEIEISFHILLEEAVFSKILPLPQMIIEVQDMNWKPLCNDKWCEVVLTFYSTRLARQKFYLEKKISSETSRVKLKNDHHLTCSSF